MKPSIDWVQLSLFAAIAIAPVGTQAQAPTPILVLEVPVELRTLEPEVTRAFVECSLSRRVYVPPADTVSTTVGTSRTQISLGSDLTGGRATESVQVVFELSDMVGEPVAPTGYVCHVVLGSLEGAEWPAVDGGGPIAAPVDTAEVNWDVTANRDANAANTIQAGTSEPDASLVGTRKETTTTGIGRPAPSWMRMDWAFPNTLPGDVIKINIGMEGTDEADAIFQAWERAVKDPGTKGNNEQGDPE